MNKPKWLELVLLSIWISPPIVGTAIVCRYFQIPFLVYCFVAIVALLLWFATILGWSWLTSSREANTLDSDEAR
jgi:hypothetical protein